MAYCKWPDKLRERLSNFRGISGGVLIKIRGVLKREAFILIIVTSLLKIYTPSVDTWRPSRDLYIALSNTSIDVSSLAQGYCAAIVIVYPYFKLDIEQDEIHKALKIKQETKWIE